ncbi:hypothetical protein L6164_004871 [Bauhinia variegata]|uniref:Uncharacterized protein n=1 Tax=Bauhinia variegata TaxID=167791 RepID=A0ACB9PP98_BAUVA|nr:hypothetical protein L6164_004871 [Bauhinia variegata]
MDLESGAPTSPNPSQLSWVNLSRNLLLAYQSFGVVYGDMSTSISGIRNSSNRKKIHPQTNCLACLCHIVGLYNTIYWNPKVVCAISPHYIFVFFRKTGIEGYFSLGGVLLCITGTEAMFTDLGHFSALSIRIAFSFVVYPCLVVQYMGQAAFLSKNPTSISRAFFSSIPLPVFWPVFVIATLATICGSQAVITATFSIVNQCQALDCFPRVKVVHTSSNIYGQIYIPEINWILMVLTLVITIGFQDIRLIGNAYGLAVMMVIFVTTFLMALVLIFIWQKSNLMAMAFLLFFWAIEGLYLAAVLTKVRDGGWVPLVISFVFMTVMLVWHYGSCRKHSFDLENKASMQWILALGPSLGIVRVPGIGFIYSEQATGVPAVFSHFVTNLPALHKVLVFVCVKSVIVPYVPPQERFLIGRVGPRPFRMYRCVVRYGYKDIHCHDGDFENQVIQSIAEFTHREAMEPRLSSGVSSPVSSVDEKMRVISDRISCSSLVVSENEGVDLENSISIARAASRSSLQRIHEEENSPVRKRKVRFQVAENPPMDPDVGEELTDLVEAKEAGVTYVLGHLVVKAKKSSSFLKKLVIDVGYAFLRQNCRGRAVALNIPHISLIEIGMTYYV